MTDFNLEILDDDTDSVRSFVSRWQAAMDQSQGRSVKMIHLPKHRAYPGWYAVQWSNNLFYPDRTRIHEWLAANTTHDHRSASAEGRCYFEDEQDALMCLMAFK